MGRTKKMRNPGPSLTGIDAALGRKALERVQVVKDGSCLFRAVAHQYHGTQEQHVTLRKTCVDYIRRNKDYFQEFLDRPVDEYAKMLSSLEYWGGEPEIVALHRILRRDIIIYREEEGGKVTEKVYNAVSIRGLPPIRLVFMGNEHYDCVYQRGWCKRAGFCQALLYEALYNKVFHEDTPSSASISKLVERPLPSPSSPSPSVQGGTAEVAADMDRQPTQFSRCLLESLAENHYRNIAVEVYQNSKQAQVEADLSLALAMQTSSPDHKFSPGDDCKVVFQRGLLVNGQVRKVLDNGRYEVHIPTRRRTQIITGDKLKRIDVLEVASDGESTADKAVKHPSSKPHTKATGSGSQSRFTRDGESSQPPRVRERPQYEGRSSHGGQGVTRRQPSRGQGDLSGGSDGVKKERWQGREQRAPVGHTVSTHNAGIRTQGRGRYDGRPAKVVGQNGYQTSVNSRAPGATAEQRATLPAPSPDKLTTKEGSPQAKDGQSPADVSKDTVPNTTTPQPAVTSPAVQQNRGGKAAAAAPPTPPTDPPSSNHASLTMKPPPAEVPNPPPALPSPMQSSPKGEVDTLSSTSSSSSCNSDKITAIGSQPSTFTSFSTSLVSISGLPMKSGGEGDEEGHFTAVTAQLPPPPLSDFYDRKFSSLDAFFSEYGRKCFDVYCQLRPTAKEMFESISPPSEWPDLTPPEEDGGDLNEPVAEDDEAEGEGEEEDDDEEEIKVDEETVVPDDTTIADPVIASSEAISPSTSVAMATSTVDEVAMETRAVEQPIEEPEPTQEDEEEEEEESAGLPKPVEPALYQHMGIPRPAIRHMMPTHYYSVPPGYMPQYQPPPAGWVPPPYPAPPYMQHPYHPSYQYYHPMMMMRPPVQPPLQPSQSQDGEKEPSGLPVHGSNTNSDLSGQQSLKQSPQPPSSEQQELKCSPLPYSEQLSSKQFPFPSSLQQGSKHSPFPPSPTSSTSGISSDVAHGNGNGNPPPPQGDHLQQVWPMTSTLRSDSPVLEEMEAVGEEEEEAASKDVFSSEVTTTESESDFPASEKWARPMKRQHELTPRHKGRKSYSLNRAITQQIQPRSEQKQQQQHLQQPRQQQQQQHLQQPRQQQQQQHLQQPRQQQQQHLQQPRQQQQQQQSGERGQVQQLQVQKPVRRMDTAKPRPHPLQFQEVLRAASPATQSRSGRSNHGNLRKVTGPPGHVDYDVAMDDMSPTAQQKRHALDVALSQYSFTRSEDTIHSITYGASFTGGKYH